MALVVKDRVKETSTTSGTGTLTLAGAVSGFQSFSVIGNANTTYYAIVDGATGDWEVGIGTYTSSGTTLSRDTVLESSNSGSLVPFAGNTKEVFVTYPAERSLYVDGSSITPATSASLPVGSGGTGATSLTGVLIGNGTSAVTTKTNPSGDFVGTTDTQTLSAKTITNLIFDGSYTEEVFTITDGASVDLDPANGTIQLWTLGASRVPTANNFTAGESMTLMINDGTAYTITWPSVVWTGGSAPTLATTGYTVVELWKVSTTLYGALVGEVA